MHRRSAVSHTFISAQARSPFSGWCARHRRLSQLVWRRNDPDWRTDKLAKPFSSRGDLSTQRVLRHRIAADLDGAVSNEAVQLAGRYAERLMRFRHIRHTHQHRSMRLALVVPI